MKFVVEYRRTFNEYVYRKLSLVVADSPVAASKIIWDQLLKDQRLDYKFHSCEPLR